MALILIYIVSDNIFMAARLKIKINTTNVVL